MITSIYFDANVTRPSAAIFLPGPFLNLKRCQIGVKSEKSLGGDFLIWNVAKWIQCEIFMFGILKIKFLVKELECSSVAKSEREI